MLDNIDVQALIHARYPIEQRLLIQNFESFVCFVVKN
jgi:hypothetical protein